MSIQYMGNGGRWPKNKGKKKQQKKTVKRRGEEGEKEYIFN